MRRTISSPLIFFESNNIRRITLIIIEKENDKAKDQIGSCNTTIQMTLSPVLMHIEIKLKRKGVLLSKSA